MDLDRCVEVEKELKDSLERIEKRKVRAVLLLVIVMMMMSDVDEVILCNGDDDW